MTVEVQKYFELMKDIEENVLSYIEENDQEHNFFNYLDKQKININKQIFKSFLYLLVHLSNNYHRPRDFYCKIDTILTKYKSSISNFFQNSEIFHIFQSNKRILFFLIQQKLLTIDLSIVDFFQQKSYNEYFYPEIESFLSEKDKKEIKNKIKELKEDDISQYNEKRKIGENDNYICYLIRNDQVIDFIAYIEKNNISPESIINNSFYETNHFLMNNEQKVTLIEYSAFFGSQQIFQYLTRQNAELKPEIWLYVIHGKNAEIIHFLEDNHVKTLSNSYQYLIRESIKCHHNEISDYFQLNFCDNFYSQYLLQKHLKYYNFDLKHYKIEHEIQMDYLYYYFCKYDYSIIVEAILSIHGDNYYYINQEFEIYKPYGKHEDVVISINIKNQNIIKDQEYEYLSHPRDDDDDYDEEVNYTDREELPEDFLFEWYFHHYGKEPWGKSHDWLIRKYKKNTEDYQSDEYEYPEDKKYKRGGIFTYNHYLEILTALHISSRKGNIDIIQLLLNSKKIDISIKSRKYSRYLLFSVNDYTTTIEKRTLLHEAIESGYVDVVKIILNLNKININDVLIKSKKSIDAESTANMRYRKDNHNTSLFFASEKGYSEIVRLLLEQENVDINQKSIEVLFKRGGCIVYENKRRRIEKTLLHSAIENEHLNIVKICSEHPKIDINLPLNELSIDLPDVSDKSFEKAFKDSSESDFSKTYPLFMAVSKDNIDIVRLLLNHHEIDINAQSTYGWYHKTALHEAVIKNHVEIVKLLLQQKKIDIYVYDDNNKKPINYAKNNEIKKTLNNLARKSLFKKLLLLISLVLLIIAIRKY